MSVVYCPDEARAIGVMPAIVLQQLRYWLDIAKGGKSRFVVERGGFRWVARSRDQLCDQIGISEKQLRTVLSKLRNIGAIVTVQHIFDNKTINHYRLTEGFKDPVTSIAVGAKGLAQSQAGDLIKSDKTKVAQQVAPGGGDKGAVGQAQQGSLSTIETKGKTNRELAPALPDAPLSEEKFEEVSSLGSRKAAFGETKAAPAYATKPGDLGLVFRAAYTATYPDRYLPSLTAKDLGQLKHFRDRCPPGIAGKVLDHAVRNWSSFCSRAVTEEGAIEPPVHPSIATLLRFVASAVNLYNEDSKPAFKPAPKPAPKPVAKPVEVEKPEPQPGDDDYVPKTVEELAKLFGYDD